jgi:hypothetical protein
MSDPAELKNIVRTAPAEPVARMRKRTDELIAQNA